MQGFTECIFDLVHEDIVWNNGSQCCKCDVIFEKRTLKEEFFIGLESKVLLGVLV